jgi:cell division septation protein DedD
MIAGRRPLQARHELRFGTRELVIFCGAFLLVWALTFVFGILVGREMTEPGPGVRAGVGSPAARPPLAEPVRKAERAGPDERLTFYKTLTAPTPELPPTDPPKVEERIVPREPAPRPAPRAPAPPHAAARAGSAAASPAEAAVIEEPGERRPPVDRPVPTGRLPAPRRAEAAAAPAPGPITAADPLWTVQVSSFRSRALAEDLRSRLAAKGFDAYLVSVTSEEGRVRHRVRVGAFPTRAEAERIAVELKGERSLNPFVTTRQR